MFTGSVTPDLLGGSVIAVPPMARNSQGAVCKTANQQIVRHIEAGGVSTLLYGGNANFYHIRPSEYESTLATLVEIAAESTWMIPSAGPSFGLMMDQADVLRDFDFPTTMILPQQEIATPPGIATGTRLFAERLGRPVVLYLKHNNILPPSLVASLQRDGVLAAIKYAVVRDNPADDPYLKSLVADVDPSIIVSGIGEQPAIVHLRDFGLNGFTAGCVCVAPKLSMQLLQAIKAGDFEHAETIREIFVELEDLRNNINPIRVLHEAVRLAGIADTGSLTPLLSGIESDDLKKIEIASKRLLSC
jgi:dihydrodipicolinate synthase/N-acetylneuraminate lyase